MILHLLIHACNHSTTQNIATSAEEAFVILDNNCSLPPSGDCCYQNVKATSGNMVARTLKSKFEFPILNRLISRLYSRLIYVSFQYNGVWPPGLQISDNPIDNVMRNGEGLKLIQYIIAWLAIIFCNIFAIFIRRATRFWEGQSYWKIPISPSCYQEHLINSETCRPLQWSTCMYPESSVLRFHFKKAAVLRANKRNACVRFDGDGVFTPTKQNSNTYNFNGKP